MSGSSSGFCLCLLLLTWACTSEENTSGTSPQWKKTAGGIYSLEMADVLMEVDPAAGGRIKTMAIDGFNLLTGPEIDTINYGSTLWLSPQRLWYWPPPATLDREVYQVLQSYDSLYLQSGVDSTFAVSFKKSIIPQAEDTSFLVTYSIQNHSDSLQRYALWEVTRMLKDSRVHFRLEEDSTLRSIREPFWNRKALDIEVTISSQDTLNNKMYANGEGWLIYLKDSLALIKTFPDLSYSELPPTHNEVEVYIAKTPYQEVEQHSPFVSLSPGEVYQWQVCWYPRKIRKEADFKALIEKLRSSSAPI